MCESVTIIVIKYKVLHQQLKHTILSRTVPRPTLHYCLINILIIMYCHAMFEAACPLVLTYGADLVSAKDRYIRVIPLSQCWRCSLVMMMIINSPAPSSDYDRRNMVIEMKVGQIRFWIVQHKHTSLVVTMFEQHYCHGARRWQSPGGGYAVSWSSPVSSCRIATWFNDRCSASERMLIEYPIAGSKYFSRFNFIVEPVFNKISILVAQEKGASTIVDSIVDVSITAITSVCIGADKLTHNVLPWCRRIRRDTTYTSINSFQY